MAVKMGPPHKHSKSHLIRERSNVIFFKNGKAVDWPFQNLRQELYHIGISLFNYARVRINTDATIYTYKGEKYEPFTSMNSNLFDHYKPIAEKVLSQNMERARSTLAVCKEQFQD